MEHPAAETTESLQMLGKTPKTRDLSESHFRTTDWMAALGVVSDQARLELARIERLLKRSSYYQRAFRLVFWMSVGFVMITAFLGLYSRDAIWIGIFLIALLVFIFLWHRGNGEPLKEPDVRSLLSEELHPETESVLGYLDLFRKSDEDIYKGVGAADLCKSLPDQLHKRPFGLLLLIAGKSSRWHVGHVSSNLTGDLWMPTMDTLVKAKALKSPAGSHSSESAPALPPHDQNSSSPKLLRTLIRYHDKEEALEVLEELRKRTKLVGTPTHEMWIVVATCAVEFPRLQKKKRDQTREKTENRLVAERLSTYSPNVIDRILFNSSYDKFEDLLRREFRAGGFKPSQLVDKLQQLI